MEKRPKSEFERSRQTTIRSQSRIADYIKGKLSLDQIVSKDRIIKPEERHNKRAFLPLINEQVKIIPRKLRDPRTIEVKIDTRRPVQSKTKIREYDPITAKFRTPKPAEKKRQTFSINLDDYYVVLNKGAKGNAIEYKHDDYSTPGSQAQTQTPSTESSCNDLIPIISNVNNTAPDTNYYEETLVTKNDEISMLKEKIRNLQKNIVAKNSVDTDDETVLGKMLQSLTHLTNAMKILKNAQEQHQIIECVTQIEQEQDQWYSYVATISDGMKSLKYLNTTLKTDNAQKTNQLDEKHAENENLLKQLLQLEQEAKTLKNEKQDYSEMLNETKNKLKIVQKENENLLQQLKHQQNLGDKAHEELNRLNNIYEKLQIELEEKQRVAGELSEKLNNQIAQLEAANVELLSKYQRACEEVEKLAVESEHNAATAEQRERRYEEEMEALNNAKQAYIESLQKEAEKMKSEITTLEKHAAEVSEKNKQYYSQIVELTNENQTLKDDSKYKHQEKNQLYDAISEWCKSESLNDSVNLIEMIDNLKMRMVIAETNYSNRLLENLEQTVKFTHLLNGQLDQ